MERSANRAGISGRVRAAFAVRRGSYRRSGAPGGGARRKRPWAALLLAAAASGGAGCVSLRPYAEVRAALPPAELVEVDGRSVHVESRGEGPPLLLLHGFGGSTFAWEPVAAGLGRHRRVVAIDLNGFGWTERPRGFDAYTLAGQMELVLGVADALGFDRFDLGGHSYGGALSLYLTAHHPERVRSLLLVDSALPSYATLRRSRIYACRPLVAFAVHTYGISRRRVARTLRGSYADDSKVTPALVEAYLERLRVEGAVDAFRGLSAPTGAPPDEVDFSTLRLPTLVVWGAEDAFIPASDGRKFADAIAGASFVELPGCGHSAMEECPNEFLAAVEPFYAGGTPP